MSKQLYTKISCTCGKVQGHINSPSALRLVCHCVDCRNYYQALNVRGGNKLAPLTPWGGVDLTQINPNELTFDSGKDQLKLAKISENYAGKPSVMPRVYAKCCDTPLYTHGMAILFNTHLIDEADRFPIKYNIMGRMATPKDQDSIKGEKPKISSSVPFTWPFVMMGRAGKASKNKSPAPWDLPDITEAEVIEVKSYLGKAKKDQTAPNKA